MQGPAPPPPQSDLRPGCRSLAGTLRRQSAPRAEAPGGGDGPGQRGGGGPHLRLREHQRGGHLEALGPRQVLVELELVLQLQQLLAGEGGARPAALPQQVRLRLGCGRSGVRRSPARPSAHPRGSWEPLPAPQCQLPSQPHARAAPDGVGVGVGTMDPIALGQTLGARPRGALPAWRATAAGLRLPPWLRCARLPPLLPTRAAAARSGLLGYKGRRRKGGPGQELNPGPKQFSSESSPHLKCLFLQPPRTEGPAGGRGTGRLPGHSLYANERPGQKGLRFLCIQGGLSLFT